MAYTKENAIRHFILLPLTLAITMFAVAQTNSDPNAAWTVLFYSLRANPGSAWKYEARADIDGKEVEFAFSGNLVIRCKQTCEVFIVLVSDISANQSSVRVSFNNAPAQSFGVTQGRYNDSLFFTSPMAVIDAIKNKGGYMTVEYSPSADPPKTETFGVWNLPPTILARLERAGKNSADSFLAKKH